MTHTYAQTLAAQLASAEIAPVQVSRGSSPVVLGLPHTGTWLPPEVRQALNRRGLVLADTDWHVEALYEGLLPQATVVRCQVHRYAIDVNRDPEGESLYPGQNTTGLCPETDFDGKPIYREGMAPDADAVARRRAAVHAPYHAAMRAEMERVRGLHGHAILFDCHSIRSQIPYLFAGRLPDFNVGTNGGVTCAPEIEGAVMRICESARPYASVLNGRFKGGWTTRAYGRPSEGWHAIQLELAQRTYMAESPPWRYEPAKAVRLRRYLRNILETLAAWRPA